MQPISTPGQTNPASARPALPQTPGETIERIHQRGFIRAGVSQGIRGLSLYEPAQRVWQGFDVELAKALALAVTGDRDAVEFVPTAPSARFEAVSRGDLDIGTFNASATLGRELDNGLVFPQPMLHDGEAFLVRTAELQPHGAPSVATLERRVVAVQRGATSRANLERWFRKEGLAFELVEHATPQQALQAYAQGECNLYALDRIPLTGERLRLADPELHTVLDPGVSKEAMGPVVRAADPIWVRAVTWVMRCLIEAEERGISRAMCSGGAPLPSAHLEFLQPPPGRCRQMGLVDHFVQGVIGGVGNYAEIFDRTLGLGSTLNLTRGRNALWCHGGLLISPSFD
jgi:ABC-type amino acid transport substrate-binding protein